MKKEFENMLKKSKICKWKIEDGKNKNEFSLIIGNENLTRNFYRGIDEEFYLTFNPFQNIRFLTKFENEDLSEISEIISEFDFMKIRALKSVLLFAAYSNLKFGIFNPLLLEEIQNCIFEGTNKINDRLMKMDIEDDFNSFDLLTYINFPELIFHIGTKNLKEMLQHKIFENYKEKNELNELKEKIKNGFHPIIGKGKFGLSSGNEIWLTIADYFNYYQNEENVKKSTLKTNFDLEDLIGTEPKIGIRFEIDTKNSKFIYNILRILISQMKKCIKTSTNEEMFFGKPEVSEKLLNNKKIKWIKYNGSPKMFRQEETFFQDYLDQKNTSLIFKSSKGDVAEAILIEKRNGYKEYKLKLPDFRGYHKIFEKPLPENNDELYKNIFNYYYEKENLFCLENIIECNENKILKWKNDNLYRIYFLRNSTHDKYKEIIDCIESLSNSHLKKEELIKELFYKDRKLIEFEPEKYSGILQNRFETELENRKKAIKEFEKRYSELLKKASLEDYVEYLINLSEADKVSNNLGEIKFQKIYDAEFDNLNCDEKRIIFWDELEKLEQAIENKQLYSKKKIKKAEKLY